MAEHILVPVDGSPLSRRALEVACEEYSDGEISALHVIDPTEPGYSVYGADPELARAPRQGSNDWYSTGEEHAEELFAELEEVTTPRRQFERRRSSAGLIGKFSRMLLTTTSIRLSWGVMVEAMTHHSCLARPPRRSCSGRRFGFR